MIFKTVKEARDYSKSNPSETFEYKDYFNNGQLREHLFYVNGNPHGEYKLYHKNGQLYNNCFYVNGKVHGESKTYNRNGQLRYHYFHVNGEEINVEHLKDSSYKSLCIKNTLFNGNVIDEDI